MKKIFFFLLAVVSVHAAFAQKGKSKVGITTGIAWSNLEDDIDGNDKTDTRTGASIGIVLDAPINPCWAFQPAVQYIQKGFNTIKSNALTNYTALRYAEIQLNVLKTGKKGLYAGLGPVLSFAMPSKTVTKNSDGTSEKPLVFGNDPVNSYRGLDYGANAVIGIKCKNGILAGFNYTLGLRNLTPGGGDPKLKSGSIGFKVGYLFK